jgi:hypothetical protein
MENDLEFGLIKWFDQEKGFGVIQASFDQEYFLHISNLIEPNIEIQPLDVFVFLPKINSKNNRLEAHNVRDIQGVDDFDVIMRFFPQADTHTFEIPFKNNRGVFKKVKRAKSLRKIALDELLLKVGPEAFMNRVLVFLDNEFDRAALIPFMMLFCQVVNSPRAIDIKRHSEMIFSKFDELLDAHQKFEVWRSKKFFLLGLSTDEEFSLSLEELEVCFDQLEEEDLKRVAQESNSQINFPHLLDLHLGPIIKLNWDQALFYKNTLKLLPDDLPEIDNELDKRLFELELKEVDLILEGLPPINTWKELDGYSKLMDVSGLKLSEKSRQKLNKRIEQAIRKTAAQKLICPIWLEGKLSEITDEEVFGYFLEHINNEKIKKTILNKLAEPQLLPLFKGLIESATDTYGFQFFLDIFYDFIKGQNPYKTIPSLLAKSADEYNWEQLKFGQTVQSLRLFILENTGKKFKVELFKQGHHFSELGYSDFLAFENLMEFQDWERIFNEGYLEKAEILDFLQGRLVPALSSSEIQWVLEMASTHLEEEQFQHLDLLAYQTYTEAIYFESWVKGFGSILPRTFLVDLCASEKKLSTIFSDWTATLNIIKVEVLFSIYIDSLSSTFEVKTKNQFDKYYEEIGFFASKDKKLTAELQSLKNRFFNLLVWYFDTSKGEIFDFEYLKKKFIYFEPSAQTLIIKRLFYLKETGSFDFTLDQLNALTRVDSDIYRLILAENPSQNIDISTDVIIKFLYHLGKESRILMDRDILSIIYSKVGSNTKSRFQLDQYFPKCEGRTTLKYSFKDINGKIFKVPFNDKFYIGIRFPTNTSSFQDYVNEIKEFPVRKWNPELKHWGVAAKSINEVKEFAKRNRFFINFTDNKFNDNPHLANEIRTPKPSGVKFCEGRKSIKQHQTFERDFWWCRNDACYKNNEPSHDSESWEHYTALDFLNILTINTDEKLKNGSTVPKGIYYQFVSTLNRMEQLLEVLYCRSCDELLHPIETSNFAAYNTTRFACANKKCDKHNHEVYLTHCLNGRCMMLIDSRDSKQCSNGMYICKHCTCCCSNQVYKRIANKLQLVGKPISSDLRYKIENKVGHLDKREHFCYKCGNQLVNEGGEDYECKICLYEVDLTKYKFNLRIGYQNNSDDESEDLPF